MTIIRNPAAYAKAVQRNIHYNAAITRNKKWEARREDGRRLSNWLTQSGEFASKRIPNPDPEWKRKGEPSEIYEAHAATKGMFAGDFGNFLISLRDFSCGLPFTNRIVLSRKWQCSAGINAFQSGGY